MKREEKLPELLAPAGGQEALYAAVEAGADAVYLGGRFNARAYAKNFDGEALLDGVRYAHLYGVKVYVTLNTLLFSRECAEFLAYAKTVRDAGADAAIVQDMGAIRFLRKALPDLPIHASTQGFIHNTETADFYASLGCTRVVGAREMSLADIREMTERCVPEVEVFLHGALCVCHSGECLFSSVVGGRSGNRGECAQPCRLPYNGKYPLSLRDLCLARHVPELIGSGVSSLKIEGRMKSPSYVYGVTSVYRRLLDEGRNATDEEIASLSALFSRGGFTDGYFTGKITAPMTGVRSEEDKENTKTVTENVAFLPMKKRVSARAVIEAGKPSLMTVSDGTWCVTVTGEEPTPAKTAPLTAAGVTDKLIKTGGTYLSLSPADLDLSLGEGLFLTNGALGALRRAAAEAFCDTCRPPMPDPVLPPPEAGKAPAPGRSVLCYRPEQVEAVAGDDWFDRVYHPLLVPDFDRLPVPDGVALPPVVMPRERDAVLDAMKAAAARGVKYGLCAHYGQIALCREAGLLPAGDFRLNVTNPHTLAVLRDAGVSDVILSPELSLGMLSHLPGRVLTYGRIPLMVTERCFVKENFGCGACGKASLTDRRGVSFPILRLPPHRNLILNSLATYMGDKRAELRAAGIVSEHYLFTTETKGECEALIRAAREGSPLSCAVRRIKA